MLFYSNGQIAFFIKSFYRDTSKIPRTGQSNIDQPGQKIIHSAPPQGCAIPNNQTFASLECSNGFFCRPRIWTLSGNQRKEFYYFVTIFIFTKTPDPSVYDHFLDARHRHRILVSKFFPERRSYFLY